MTKISSLDVLVASMTAIHITDMTGGPMDIALMANCIQRKDIQEISKFYDRNEKYCDWYYQCYGSTDNAHQTTKTPYVNSIAHWLGLERTNNPIIIAKNGPTGTNWIKDMSIASDDVARTIWWHHASGNDRSQVCGE